MRTKFNSREDKKGGFKQGDFKEAKKENKHWQVSLQRGRENTNVPNELMRAEALPDW